MNTVALKHGNKKHSDTALKPLPSGKPVTSSSQVKVLTKSEIKSLQQDKRQALKEMLAMD